MARKKPPNWEDIKTRVVVNAEKPEDIAKIYNVAAQTIHNRCSKEKWREERVRIGKEIRESVIEDRKRLMSKVGKIMERMVDRIGEHLDAEMIGVSVQDGEGFPNKYFLEAWRSLAAAYAKLEEAKAENNDETEASRPVYRSVYTDSESDGSSETDSEGEG